MTRHDFITRVDLPRSSLATFLCDAATYDKTIRRHHRSGRLPYVFVAPPSLDPRSDEEMGGWAMIEWVFSAFRPQDPRDVSKSDRGSRSKIRFRAIQSFNPEGGRAFAIIYEDLTPSADGHHTFIDEGSFFFEVGRAIKNDALCWYEGAQVRMGSRHQIHDKLQSHPAFAPHDHKIMHDVEKKMCFLALSVFETFARAAAIDYHEMIKTFDKTLSVCYLPLSPDVTYNAVFS